MKKITLSIIGALIASVSTLGVSAAADQVACTMQYDPVCGTTIENGQSVRKTYGNMCVATATPATNITKGECEPIVDDTPAMVGLIEWAYSKNLTQYNTQEKFKPTLSMSRQEAAALSVRMAKNIFGKSTDAMKTALIAPYTDDKSLDVTLKGDVYAARYLGVMQGLDNVFSPHRALSRAEALVILIRAVDGKKLNESHSLWYQAYADRANELGLTFANLKGFNEPISRGEFIEWIHIVSHNVMKKDANLHGTWKLQNVSTLTEAENKELVGLKITTSFDDTRMGANICNAMGGDYSIVGGKLVVPNMISTMMYCQGILGKIEGLFQPNGATYTVTALRLPAGSTGSTMQLQITMPSGSVFTYGNTETPPAPAPKTILGDWTLIGYQKMAFADIKKGGYQDITLSLKEKEFTANICNSLWGAYTLSGNTITNSGGTMSTRMACADATRTAMEAGFVLEGATYERFTVNFLIATDEPSEQLRIMTKSGVVYTFGKK